MRWANAACVPVEVIFFKQVPTHILRIQGDCEEPSPVFRQVQSKTEAKPNFGFKRVREEQRVNFSVFNRNKFSRD